MKKERIFYLILAFLTIVIGLGSRMCSPYLPYIINLGLGDALWAMMLYWLLRAVWLEMPIIQMAILTYLICCLVEGSQLYQADWINTIRSYRLGRLVLGYGFLWSDFLAYAIGVGASAGLEYRTKKKGYST